MPSCRVRQNGTYDPRKDEAIDPSLIPLDVLGEAIRNEGARAIYCDACFNKAGKFNDILRVKREALVMIFKAWFVLFASLVVVTMSVVSELRDIKLCEISKRQYGGRHHGLALIGAIRTYCVITFIHIILPSLLLFRGPDAFNICMKA